MSILRTRKKKNRKKAVLIRSFGIILLLGVLCVGLYGLNTLKINQKKDDESEKVYKKVKEESVSVDDTKTEPTGKKTKKKNDDEKSIDWSSLGGHDVVGWIVIDGIADYPVVKGTDNSYYLTHLYDGTYNYNGSIFVSCDNNKDFMDLNTIIYGHNMGYTGQMFGKVKQLLEDNPDNPSQIEIYTPDGMEHIYDIYSIDRVKDLGYAYKTQFGTIKSFLDYKEELHENSEKDFGVKKSDGRTIMISTCDSYGSQEGNRLVVIAQEKEIRKVSDPADWYEQANYIEINNTKASCLKGNNAYYVVQDDIAVRCREEIVSKLILPGDEAVVRVEYEKTSEAYEYDDGSGNSIIYPIVDIIDYVTE